MLQRRNFADSVGDEVQIHCKKKPKWKTGERCWQPIGPVQIAYEELKDKLNDTLEKQWRESAKKRGLMHAVYMIGLEENNAIPVLVFVGLKLKYAQEAEEIVKTHCFLKSNAEINFETASMNALPSGELQVLATDVGPCSQHHSEDRRVSEAFFAGELGIRPLEMPIFVRHGDSTRRATANVLERSEVLTYLTVAHIFELPQALDEESDGWDSDSDFDNQTVLSRVHCPEETASAYVPLDAYIWRPLGLVSETCTRADWAIVELHSAAESELPLMEGYHLSNRYSEPQIEEVWIRTSHGWLSGSIKSISPVHMQLDDSGTFQAVYQFQHDEPLRPGDCGSLVISRRNMDIYGQVIAGSKGSQVGFMIPTSALPLKSRAQSGSSTAPQEERSTPKEPVSDPVVPLSAASQLSAQLPMQSRSDRVNLRCGPHGERLVAGVVPLSTDKYHVLLVQSNKRGGWVLPKGNWELDEVTAQDAAKRKAWEEAGIICKITDALGTMPGKRRADQIATAPEASYHFFEAVVEKQEAQWPEMHKRSRQWFTYTQAREALSHKPELLDALDRCKMHR